MPNSYIVIGILAVVGIILSLIWMKNATLKYGQVEKIEEDESVKWAVKWNRERELEKTWCDGKCSECDADRCPFREVVR